MQAIATAIGFILQKIVGMVAWIGELFVKVFQAFWDLITDAFVWVFDSMLGLVVTILGAFDFSGLAGTVGAWASVSQGMMEVFGAIGLTTAVGLVVTAIGIRIMLQLVPFTRLGS